MSLEEKLKKVKLLVMDVDGVLTEGKITYDSEGREIKNFDVKDGYGIVRFRRAGYKTAIITARKSRPVTIRARDLKIDRVYQNAYPKLKVYQRMLGELKMQNEDVCFIGDDLADIDVLRQVGLSVAVADASEDVKQAVDFVTVRKGGCGAVREVIEMILKAQGKWQDVVEGRI